ncbi:hypothetical protein G6F57_013111 [Rhizopus arrhizus]|uniref:Aurora kinase n=1 Tax=Rhizopus oryzae TaxID=64495 RepID=A0A9P6X0W0_RHIOR|nr:hypothetical protein G6F23_010689 [Rhizopus arrhizus]KAG1399109.1 hypothetical protein G6F58_011191 [Rhizopus delemar]KAG0780726.1 hypothetical protein G6F22_009933 [Rhizopus arrhizus]KAG0790329.1 hypothetical protein G6F21_005885 [Rhizopus arrhizus]KAG0812115.1 hypothetical protein G6F20_006620 [Rhizopus arrhizus]
MNQNTTPLSNYVDYSARGRLKSIINPNLETSVSGISAARERRARHFHQLAQQSIITDPGVDSIMDSPLVRRHVGINAQVAEIHSDDSDVDETLLFDKSEWRIEDFKVGKHLGTGKKEELENSRVVQFIKREIEIQAHLHHPNIIRLFGYFHDETNIYVVLEYAEQGELYKKLEAKGRFSEAEAAKYIVQLSDALEYMHSFGVIHRDLKLENILLSKQGSVKLGDFGWSVHDPRPRRRTFCGTLDYLPPEMIANEPHTEAVDVWSLGVICYELIVGKPPFEELDDTVEKTYNRITRVDIQFPQSMTTECKQFILKVILIF